MPGRMYETRLLDAGIDVAISSVPSGSLPASGVEVLIGTAVSPLIVPGHPTALRHLRDLVAFAVLAAVNPAEVANYTTGDIAGSLAGERSFYGQLSGPHQDLVDHAVDTPIVAVENSWPEIASLASIFAGTGTGLAVGGPPGALVGLVLTSVGTIVLTAGKAAAQAFGPRVGERAAVIVTGEDARRQKEYESAMNEIERLEGGGKIGAEDAKEMRKRVFEQYKIARSDK